MPKMKTKASVKKRFKVTGSGKIVRAHANKRHGMIKRTPKQIRQLRGTTVAVPADVKVLRKFMPYAR